MAKSQIIDHLLKEQKEAYKMLKIVRETELKDYILQGTLHIGDQLTKRLTSCHLKLIFLTLSIGNNGIRSVREWLVLYLKELIICLQKQSIRHYFVDDLELLRNVSMDSELKEVFKYNLIANFELTFEEFKRSIPLHLKINGECLNTCKILETIFKKSLETLPANLSELTNKCKHKDVIELLK